ITWITEKLTRKKLVADDVFQLLAKISGWMLATYIIAKIVDTIYWAAVTAPDMGFHLMEFYSGNPVYGIWILILEIVIGGVVPAAILITRQGRENRSLLLVAALLAVIGVCANRWVMVLQTLAMPVLPFEEWFMYAPSWQEVATTILPVAYGILLISLAHRYLPVFPQEKELNP
ncbi:MAG: molybdopterin oxidoreductase, partial [Desulfosalsimonadaceae bacterium]